MENVVKNEYTDIVDFQEIHCYQDYTPIEKNECVEKLAQVAGFFICIKTMNKRIKKKKEKQRSLREQLLAFRKDLPKPERYGINFNHEGYPDPTAAAVMKKLEKELRHAGKG